MDPGKACPRHIWIWGKTVDEEGEQTSQLSPRICDNLSAKKVISLATGGHHTLALSEAGTVYSWGDNSLGQLGHGHFISLSSPSLIRSFTLRSVLNQMKIEEIAAGVEHSLARSDTGVVFSWGGNPVGQLGRENIDPETPHILLGLASKKITQLSSGSSHCLALTEEREVYSWGRGANGRTGQGATISLPRPRKIKGLKDIMAISCGWSHSFALDREGKVWAFGRGESGQLGLASPPSDVFTPISIPQKAFGGECIRTIVGGFIHSAAITVSGRLFTWGFGRHGQLGTGDDIDQHFPTEVSSLFHRDSLGETWDVIDVALGGFHSTFVTSNGAVYTCGLGGNGQLGRGNNHSSVSPYPIEPFSEQGGNPSSSSHLPMGRVSSLMCGKWFTIAICDVSSIPFAVVTKIEDRYLGLARNNTTKGTEDVVSEEEKDQKELNHDSNHQAANQTENIGTETQWENLSKPFLDPKTIGVFRLPTLKNFDVCSQSPLSVEVDICVGDQSDLEMAAREQAKEKSRQLKMELLARNPFRLSPEGFDTTKSETEKSDEAKSDEGTRNDEVKDESEGGSESADRGEESSEKSGEEFEENSKIKEFQIHALIEKRRESEEEREGQQEEKGPRVNPKEFVVLKKVKLKQRFDSVRESQRESEEESEVDSEEESEGEESEESEEEEVQGRGFLRRTTGPFLSNKQPLLRTSLGERKKSSDGTQSDESEREKNDSLKDLSELKNRFRTEGELFIATKSPNSQPKCFVGTYAVDWISSQAGVSRSEAVKIGKDWEKQNLFHHIDHLYSFEDGCVVYKFTASPGSSKRLSQRAKSASRLGEASITEDKKLSPNWVKVPPSSSPVRSPTKPPPKVSRASSSLSPLSRSSSRFSSAFPQISPLSTSKARFMKRFRSAKSTAGDRSRRLTLSVDDQGRKSLPAPRRGDDVDSSTPTLTVQVQTDSVQFDNMIERVNTIVSDTMRSEKDNEDLVEGWTKRQKNLMTIWASQILPEWDRRGVVPTGISRVWRIGIPSPIRGEVWLRVIGNELCITPKLFNIFSQRAAKARRRSTRAWKVKYTSFRMIDQDIPTVYKDLLIFNEDTERRQVLREVLDAYSVHRPDIGYVKGMAGIAGMLVMFMEGPVAFVSLCNLLNTHLFYSLFCFQWEIVSEFLQKFDKYLFSNATSISRHFKKLGISPDSYACEWFRSLFANTLPLSIVCRVWDCFLLEGNGFLLRVAIAILLMWKESLMNSTTEGCLKMLTQQTLDTDPETFFALCFSLKIPVLF